MLGSSTVQETKLRTAILRAAELLVENGLGSWKIKLNNKRAILAETHHGEKSVSFSKYFVMVADKDQLEGVTLHEVTHALLGKGYGHGPEFVKLCKKISPTDDYANRAVAIPLRRYRLTCPECKYSGTHNSNKDRYCGICWKQGNTVKFKVTENKLKVNLW